MSTTSKRWLRLLAVLLAFVMIAAACGDSDDDDSGADDAETTEAPADDGDADTTEAPADDGDGADEPAADGEAVSLRWRTRPDNQAEIDVYSAVSESIDAANDSLTLEYEPGGSETSSYQDQLKTEIAAGTAPDVFWIPGTDIADFGTRGLLYDLRELADGTEGYSDDDFYPEPMFHLTFDPESGEAGPRLWGLPRDVSTFALYLNLDLISEAGAQDPRELADSGEWNWETFQEVAQAVTDTGGANRGFAMNSWWANYGYFMNAAGGGFFTEDRTACGLDSDESIEGLNFLVDLFDSGVAVPFGEDGEPPYLAGNVGMFINGRWATPGARASADFNWDVVKLPDGPAGPSNWLFWGAYVVNANTEHPEEAWQLVQELTTADTQATIAELGANIPSRTSQDALDAFLTFTPPENNQAFLDGLAEGPVAEGPLWTGSWPEYDGVMNPAVNAVLTGSRTVEDFQANICGETSVAFDG